MSLTPAQLAIRMQGIGGSEIAAVAGLSPYSRPIDVYLRKVGLAGDIPPSHHLDRGTFLEPGIIAWYSKTYGREVKDVGTLVHPKHPVVIATPDGLATCKESGERFALEVKCPSFHAAQQWGAPGTDEIPDAYRAQAIWQMAVLGVKACEVVAFIGGNIQVYQVPYDAVAFDALRHIAEDFWESHVLPQQPPESDGSDSYDAYLAEKFPRASDTYVEDDSEDMWELVEELAGAKALAKEYETRVNNIRQRLKERIGNEAGLKGGWGKVSYTFNKASEQVDYAAYVKDARVDAAALAPYTRIKPGPRVLRDTLTVGK